MGKEHDRRHSYVASRVKYNKIYKVKTEVAWSIMKDGYTRNSEVILYSLKVANVTACPPMGETTCTCTQLIWNLSNHCNVEAIQL